MILTGGKIFTADPSRPYAQALAVRGERVVAVGSTAQISKLAGPRTRRIELRGRTVVPGFNDAHTHLPGGSPLGRSFHFPKLPLLAGPSTAQVLDTLAKLARQTPAGTWLQGEIGLSVLQDPQARRAALDAVAPRHPVLLHTPWGHGCVVNSLALQQLGIGEADPDPLGGAYERDSGTGRLTGSLLEYGSWGPRRDLNGHLPDSAWVRLLRAYGAEALRFGITSVQDMAGTLPPAQTVRVVQAARLPLRHRIMPYFMTSPRGFKHGEWAGVNHQPTPLARVEGRKYVLDATPLEGGALMRRPYPGRPGWYGHLNFPADTVRQLLRHALATSDPLMLHIVGDSTASLVLHLMGQLADDATWRRKRVRFEHGDGLAPDLRPRARAMGIVVVQNASHYVADMDQQHGAATHIPAGFRSLLDSGVLFALGSDGPMNPFLNILFAATLADPKEALTREQAVRAYTAGAAYAEFQEQQKGTLAPGKLADLAVLSQDIFTVPPPALPGTVSELTMVGGKVVYEAKAAVKR
ncbi:amidohydrolase [Hymenobacter properus]|uniref:Amidohydrolase n=1 Tax=Hymenobacter properus TaxID=2791026 RepID=A0A931BJJ9_9BACT|nr:amidohydrolase [Hymenobacter properus]MBF9143477.1 amidohydrolase [Hymenobacter properus]MBR7722290.1 amidohydrolase [Microvirga sp. SRT04]